MRIDMRSTAVQSAAPLSSLMPPTTSGAAAPPHLDIQRPPQVPPVPFPAPPMGPSGVAGAPCRPTASPPAARSTRAPVAVPSGAHATGHFTHRPAAVPTTRRGRPPAHSAGRTPSAACQRPHAGPAWVDQAPSPAGRSSFSTATSCLAFASFVTGGESSFCGDGDGGGGDDIIFFVTDFADKLLFASKQHIYLHIVLFRMDAEDCSAFASVWVDALPR